MSLTPGMLRMQGAELRSFLVRFSVFAFRSCRTDASWKIVSCLRLEEECKMNLEIEIIFLCELWIGSDLCRKELYII